MPADSVVSAAEKHPACKRHARASHDDVVCAPVSVGVSRVVMDGATIGATTIVATRGIREAGYDVPLASMPARVVRQQSDAKANGTRIHWQPAADYLKTIRSIAGWAGAL
ncbi:MULTISPECIES: hypothetical protein [unclassified Burkholderia]|uniref:hypothetical protein n=1 Tax=unclassified Burkholderia TaxID=2613784 RepID=UPI00211D391B|nr:MULTISPECIES: hypothetical protein [unclassified Burkholderia]